jgi:hypothetical protein
MKVVLVSGTEPECIYCIFFSKKITGVRHLFSRAYYTTSL